MRFLITPTSVRAIEKGASKQQAAMGKQQKFKS